MTNNLLIQALDMNPLSQYFGDLVYVDTNLLNSVKFKLCTGAENTPRSVMILGWS
jgi:hypothetical protein